LCIYRSSQQQQQQKQQVGFARVVIDYATFAWLCNVFIIDSHRGGQGIGKWLLEYVILYPALQGLQRFVLAICDAHNFYKHFGFGNPSYPDWWMVCNTFVLNNLY
jgi:GNAT superfamily N-acetyltransferase